MSLMLDVARAAAGLNLVLLAVLLGIWGRNYREIRSKHTLGTLVFAGFLFAENALALYYYLTAIGLPPTAVRPMMYLQVLELVGISFLTYVTLD
ncbi:hypothetical protein BRC89_07400 [Halobacteriales archaeon QS_4_70_19]|nr:MAG: hypothetical protein BRC89_07400 [Halobacteriales archaeon QS_4_70_19]